MALIRNLEISNVDKVIALKFPAYLINHPNKTIWLLHQFRQAYDLFDALQSSLVGGNIEAEIRDIIRGADNQELSAKNRIFCNSEVTKARLDTYNKLSAEVLLPPVNDANLFRCEEQQGYIFAGGRVNSMKRQELLLRALSQTNENVKLCVAGPPESKEYRQHLEQLAEHLGVLDKVEWNLTFLSREQYAEYVNRSLAVAYVPYDEDSFGYVAMEGAEASKPIITTSDAGGVSHFVNHTVDGWVCKPTASSLAKAMDFAVANPEIAKQMGQASKLKLQTLGLTWEKTVEKLLT
jgi:glycosyltransferase involved in cell wall biosynthesis